MLLAKLELIIMMLRPCYEGFVHLM